MFFITTRSSLKIACFSNLTESLAMHIKRFKKKKKVWIIYPTLLRQCNTQQCIKLSLIEPHEYTSCHQKSAVPVLLQEQGFSKWGMLFLAEDPISRVLLEEYSNEKSLSGGFSEKIWGISQTRLLFCWKNRYNAFFPPTNHIQMLGQDQLSSCFSPWVLLKCDFSTFRVLHKNIVLLECVSW